MGGIWGHLEPFQSTSSAWPPSVPPHSIGDTHENTLLVITARLCLGVVSAFGTNTLLHCHLLPWLECSRNLRSLPATALQSYGQGWWGFSSLFVSHGGECIPCFCLCACSMSHILWWQESACCSSHPLHRDMLFLLPHIPFRRRSVFLESKGLI